MKSPLVPILILGVVVAGAGVAIANSKSKSELGRKYFLAGRISWPPGNKPALAEIFNNLNGYSSLHVQTNSNTPPNSADITVVFEPSVIGATMGDVKKLVGKTIDVMGFEWAINDAYTVKDIE